MSRKKLKKLYNKYKEVIYLALVTAMILIFYLESRAVVGYVCDPYKGCTRIPTKQLGFIEVKGGETLSDIAARVLNENPEYTRYTLRDMEYTIVKTNQMSSDYIKAGDVLAIPVPDSKANEKEESTPELSSFFNCLVFCHLLLIYRNYYYPSSLTCLNIH